jgi:aspartyl-tRNA(Asn)/glutamyl-tRNA(Gln) amidotransferase subunit C
MSVQFTRADVEALAALAELELEPDEVELFARQLGEFLGYAQEVQAVNTAGITPMAHVATSQETDRPDAVVLPVFDRDAALANAPDAAVAAGLFKVPRVFG